jgi:hypothetical protein
MRRGFGDVCEAGEIEHLGVNRLRVRFSPSGKSTTDCSLNCLSSPSDKNIPLKASGKSKV